MSLDLTKDQRHTYRNRIYWQKYRASKCGKPAPMTLTQWLACLDYFSNRCAFCGGPADDPHGLTLDHYLPMSAPDSPGLTVDNVVCCCHACNQAKDDSEPEQWIVATFGVVQGRQIISRIQRYFDSVS